MSTYAAKPYAASTLKRKYKETGIDPNTIDKLHDYCCACANFYQVANLETVWNAIHKVEPSLISRSDFDAVLSIDARNKDLDYLIFPESAFFRDGDENTILLIHHLVIYKINEDALIQMLEDESVDERVGNTAVEEDDTDLFVYDPSDFVELYEQQMGKDVYYSSDLLKYADPDYYESTAQTGAMKRFLNQKLKITHASAEEVVEQLVYSIQCSSGSGAEAVSNALEYVSIAYYEERGLEPEVKEGQIVSPLSFEQIREFVALYNDMHNNTRLPSNNGFTSAEIGKRAGGIRMPESVHFGYGFRSSMAQGNMDADELKNLVLSSTDIPFEGKQAILSGLSKAGEQIKVDKKIGRNDPCPCGSGKKYKKCCGR